MTRPAIGSRRDVWKGAADHTTGGLRKRDLKKTRDGRIVSRKASLAGKRSKGFKKLKKAGFVSRRGQLPFFAR